MGGATLGGVRSLGRSHGGGALFVIGAWLAFAGCGGSTANHGKVDVEAAGNAGAKQSAGAAQGGRAPGGDSGGGGAASAPSTAGAELGGKTNGSAGRSSASSGAGGSNDIGGADSMGGAANAAGESGAGVGRGPKLVKVDDYFIDSTEVSVAQYEEFVQAEQESALDEGPACAWNGSVVPDDWIDKLAADTSLPVTGIDWCDASTYCKWAGKRLCGHRDRAAVLGEAQLFEHGVSQWFMACGGESGAVHPAPTCNAGRAGEPTPIASSGCEGLVHGVFDLEGNVAEWVDSCVKFLDMPRFDSCFALGGDSRTEEASCYSVRGDYTRSSRNAYLGFRCCSD